MRKPDLNRRNAIEGVFGTSTIQLQDVDPGTSILDWLRLSAGHPGTKEGCASGDCGACTVVLVDADDDAPHVRSLPSCITPVAAMDRRQLITVEQLGSASDLHPVQQAMVTHHASQCGFCTPGFVMSIYSMYRNQMPATRESVIEGLSGNLCRCTGYRPIIDAALEVLREPRADRFDQVQTDVSDALAAIPDTTLDVETASQRWIAPRSLQEALTELSRDPALRPIAGSTDLGLETSQDLTPPAALLDLSRIPELKTLEIDDDTIRIGAGASLESVRSFLSPHLPGISTLLERYGSPGIRAGATLGGSLGTASPIGDLAPVLLALDATVQLASSAGSRTVSADEFFTSYRKTVRAPDELIVSASFQRLRSRDFFRVYKVSKRIEDDISAVCGAFLLSFDQNRIVQRARFGYGGMAATPARASASEAAVSGARFSAASVNAARTTLIEDFSPMSDARASSGYRMRVAGNLLERFLADLEQESGA